MQIIADNILQSWFGYNSSCFLSSLVGALLLGLFVLLLFCLHLYIDSLATDFWQKLILGNNSQASTELGNFKNLLANRFVLPPWPSDYFIKDLYLPFAISGFLLACAACLLLPWSASHCNLPSKIAFSGFSNQADILFFLGLVFASCLPQIANFLLTNEKLLLKEILNYKLTKLFSFVLATLGPIILTGQLSIGKIVQAQEEGLFGYSWLGLYFMPSFLGAIIYLNCLASWWPSSSKRISKMQHKPSDLSPFSRLLFQLAEKVNFFSLSSFFILIFGGGWNVPAITYPAYVNLGFLIAPYTDLFYGLLTFALKLALFSALWPGLYLYIAPKSWSKISMPFSIILATGNIVICALLASFYQAYLGV